MKTYIDDIHFTDSNGEKSILYPRTKQSAVEGLKERLSNLELPDITETTSTTLPNSHAGRFKFDKIGGVMEQDSTEGNQLFDGVLEQGTYNANLNKVDSAYRLRNVNNIAVSPNETYTISSTVAKDIGIYELDSNGVLLPAVSSWVSLPHTFTVANEGRFIAFALRIDDTTAITPSMIKDVMLVKGTTALPYEQYSGGIPAPNPSYPMPIKKSVVSGVKTHGKNFLGLSTKNIINGTYANGVYTSSALGSYQTIDIPLIADYFYKKDKTVYLKFKAKLISGSGSVNTSAFKNSDDFMVVSRITRPTLNTEYQEYVFGLTATQNGKTTNALVIQSTASSSNLVFEVKDIIICADINDTYEPYTESSHTFSQPIELYGKDGVQDVIIQKDGVLGVERNILYQKLSLDSMSSNDYGYTFFGSVSNRPFIGVEKYDAFLCTHLKCINRLIWNPTDIDYPCMSAGTYAQGQAGNVNVFFPKSYGIDTVGKFMQWAEDNNVMLAGPKAPTFEALPIADQIGLNSLQTYDGITYVEFDSEIQPTFKAEYGTSKVGGYALESLLTARNNDLRITAVESAVVNNL